MDITQYFIKINQNNSPEAGIPKLSKQSETPGKSFNQILSMFSFLGQSPQSEGESKSPLSFIQTSNNQMNQVDLMNVKEEDLWELESIMIQFLQEIKEFTNLPPSEVSSTHQENNEVQEAEELTAYHAIQQTKKDFSQQLEMWFKNEERSNDLTSSDFAQIMKKLELLVNELQSSDYEGHLETNHNAIQNIKKSLEEINNSFDLKAFEKNQEDNIRLLPELDRHLNFKVKIAETLENNLRIGRPFKEKDSENKVQNVGKLEETAGQFSVEMNLNTYDDENQMVSPSSKLGNSEPFIKEETYLFTKNIDELSNSKTETVMVPNSQTRLNDTNDNKFSPSSPPLSLSDFVPEVNDFAGRFLKILNGQSGSTEAKFNLFPEHLGRLEVKIISLEGLVSVQIVTESAVAKESLEGQLQQLRLSLQTQGLQVQKLEIIQQPPVVLDSSQASLSFSQGGSGSFNQQSSFYLNPEDSKKQQLDGDEMEIEIEMEQVSLTYGAAPLKTATRIDFNA